MAPWNYTNARFVDPAKQIRLLQFISGSGNGDIICSLETFWLKDAPSYAAVSYTWGSPDDLRDILVNDAKFSIRPNCHYTLVQISHQLRHDEPHFWLDSICIDQANLSEKAVQVQMMGEIFASARQIMACIGPHADNSELAISTVKQLAAFIRSTDGVCTDGMVMDKETEIARASGNYPDFLKDFTKAYIDFGNREYWNRMWIVQEARLAKHMLLLCGSECISLTDFLLLLEALLPPKEQEYVGFPQKWLQNSMYYVLAGSKHLPRNDNPFFLDTDHICRALYEYRSWRCFDFRDRLYALLGFVRWPEGVESVVPDYSISKLGLLRLVVARLQGVSWSSHSCFLGITSLVEALDLKLDDQGVSQLIEQRYQLPCTTGSHSKSPDLGLDPSHLIHFAGGYRLHPSARLLSMTTDGKLTAGLTYSPGRSRLAPKYSGAGLEIVVNGKTVGYASLDTQPGDFLLQLDQDYVKPTWMILRPAKKDFEIVGSAFPLGNAYVETTADSSYPAATRLSRRKGLKPSRSIDDPPLFDVFFNQDDFVLWCAFWNAFSTDLSLDTARVFLGTKPCLHPLSSFAVLRKTDGDFDT